MRKKGIKIYILTSECTVLGAWSNAKHLISTLNVENKDAMYYKVYRHFKKQIEQLNGNEIAPFNLTDTEGKSFEIKLDVIQ
jgi:hypothetical protein